MSEPWEQDGGLGEEDFAEGVDDEAEELGVDFHTEDVPGTSSQVPGRRMGHRDMPMRMPAQSRQPRPQHPQGGKKKFRIRAMSPTMAARSQGVVSILITKTDGSQVLLVKKG